MKLSDPLIVSVPNGLAALPGASVPPVTATLPTVPVPASVPPALTVVALTIEPSTTSLPPFTVVAPV